MTALQVDTTGVPNGEVIVPFAGQLSLLDTEDLATWSLRSGLLPPGLTLATGGAVVGTPIVPGTFEATVLASGVPGRLDTAAQLRISVEPSRWSLGIHRDQQNNLLEITSPMHPQGYLLGPWLRIAGGGEPGMDNVVIRPALYDPGPDGVSDGGAGDDIWVADLDPASLSWVVLDWEPRENVDPEPGQSAQVADGSPPSVDQGAAWADSDSGEAILRLSLTGFPPLTVPLVVLPPGWCPTGREADLDHGPGCCQIEDCAQ